MARVLVTESYISDIASAIRSKNGQSASYTPSQMASAIGSIISAGALSIISKSIIMNGTYSAEGDNADAFSDVVVDVPNTYTAGDEGKVVVEGSLISQGSMSVSFNSTYDTTSYSQIVVDVPSASMSIISKTISANGTYNPSDDSADAYSQVVVSVAGGASSDTPDWALDDSTTCEVSNSTIQYIRSYAFYHHSGLKKVDIPNCTKVGSNTFDCCINLSQVNIPKCSLVDYACFSRCESLESFSASMCIGISYAGFTRCKKMSQISIPECVSISAYAFEGCSLLTSLSLPKCALISGSFVFRSCINLESIYLLSSSVCRLDKVNVFSNTPISSSDLLGHYGSIYVPASLVDSYKATTVWSYFTDRITAYVEE